MGKHGRFLKPFTFGAYTYATDARIVVRIPRHNKIPEAENPPQSLIRMDAWDYLADAKFIPLPILPAIREAKMEFCQMCDGHGRLEDCHECKGSGVVTGASGRVKCSECGHSLIKHCPSCRAIGKQPRHGASGGPIICPKCKGKGEKRERLFPFEAPLLIGGKLCDLQYLRKLAALDGIEIAPSFPNFLAFRFAEGEGLLSATTERGSG